MFNNVLTTIKLVINFCENSSYYKYNSCASNCAAIYSKFRYCSGLLFSLDLIVSGVLFDLLKNDLFLITDMLLNDF